MIAIGSALRPYELAPMDRSPQTHPMNRSHKLALINFAPSVLLFRSGALLVLCYSCSRKGVCVTDEMADKQGVYTLSRVKGITARGLLGLRKVMLPDAVPPCEQGVLSPNSFGCVVGAHEAPNRHDRYIAEFLNDNEYRILAYIDRYGRVFSTDEPVFAPPAREPDLMIAKFEEQENPKVQVGCVQVRDDGGLMRQVSQYRLDGSKYALFDSWYDFGPYAQNLSYDTALARCYLAFVHRPKLRGTAMPSRGLDSLHRRLQEEKPLAALGSIVNDVRAAQADPVMRPPALACCFARWLEEAGLNGVRAAAGGIAEVASLLGVGSEAAAHEPLRLVRTARYANTYYLGVEDEENAPSQKTVWALESVLNRFLLIEESFRAKLPSQPMRIAAKGTSIL